MISSVEGKKLLGLRTACDGGWPLYLRAQQGPGSDWPLGPTTCIESSHNVTGIHLRTQRHNSSDRLRDDSTETRPRQAEETCFGAVHSPPRPPLGKETPEACIGDAETSPRPVSGQSWRVF